NGMWTKKLSLNWRTRLPRRKREKSGSCAIPRSLIELCRLTISTISGGTMKMKFSLMIAAALLGLTAFSYGQAGTDVKKAAEDTGKATDTAAKKTAHATKKAAVDTGKATEKAADKTGDATKAAAKDTGKGVEKGAKATGKATKTAAKETGKGVKKVGEKTEDVVK